MLILTVGAACGGDPAGPPITVSISPSTATVLAGGSQTLSATVGNSSDVRVTWTSTGGTVTGSGSTVTWAAPTTAGTYTVTVRSVADPAQMAAAVMTVNDIAVTISPATITVAGGASQAFTATVAGAANTGVTWSSSAGVASGTGPTATWVAPPTPGGYTVTATSIADPAKRATATVTVPPLVIVLTPSLITVGAGGSVPLVATVTGNVNTTVVWSVAGGTITGTGNAVTWNAPGAGGSYTLRATSAVDDGVTAVVAAVVTPIAIALTATNVTLYRGQSTRITAAVSGAATGKDALTWRTSCGTLEATGTIADVVAPQAAGDCVVRATSVTDTTRSSSLMVTVRPEYLVTSLNDVDDGACNFTHCSLREALREATITPGADEVLLGTSPLRPVSGTITLTSALPVITTPMRIRGPGAATLTIDAAATNAAQRRILTLTGASPVTIADVTLRGGIMTTAGGLLVETGSTLTLQRVTLRDNVALSGFGGGALVFGGSALVLDESIIEQNSARTANGSGGGIAVGSGSTLEVRGGTVRGNVAEGAFAGGIGAMGSSVTVTNSTITGNRAFGGGGGIAVWEGGSLTVTGGSVSNNVASSETGNGVGGAIVAGAPSVAAATRVTVLLRQVLIENNEAVTQGGALQFTRNAGVTLDRVIVRNNRVSGATSAPTLIWGGGALFGVGVTATIEQSTFRDNAVNQSRDDRDGGGGIAVAALESNTLAQIIIDRSTFANNRSNRRGGAITVEGAAHVTVTNSTLSGNTASVGGALWSRRAVILRNVTLARNNATSSAGGIGVGAAGSVSLNNVLLSRNRLGAITQSCLTSGGTVQTLGNNLSDDTSCSIFGGTDRSSVDAGIDTVLVDNGGLTLTHALQVGSAAINAGSPTTCSPIDQRGVARIGTCDIGAVEFTGAPPASLFRLVPSALGSAVHAILATPQVMVRGPARAAPLHGPRASAGELAGGSGATGRQP